MNKQLWDSIIGAITTLLAVAGSLFAAYKVILDMTFEKTKRLRIEQEEITRREEIRAKETSVGKEALEMIRHDITSLKEAKVADGDRMHKIERIVQQLEFAYDIIEKRMLTMFPNR